jgi:YidC/Oxa1 family membrane protein insertase
VIFIVNFEAGLILYWITTNVWTIGQQLLVKKLYPKPEPLDPRDAVPEQKPARGKPATAAAAVSDGDPAGKAKAKPKASGKQKAQASGGGNGGPTKAPPASPRKKKKRSGRRR